METPHHQISSSLPRSLYDGIWQFQKYQSGPSEVINSEWTNEVATGSLKKKKSV